MTTDPYHAVQQEIQSSLQTATQLRASYVRIRNMAVREDSEELIWARNELKATLAALEADFEDLEESVKIVETTGARIFGIEEAELMERKKYVAHVRRELESMRAEVSDSPLPPTPRPIASRSPAPPEEDDHQGAWAREEQQMMIREQDRTIDSISNTLTTLAQQAGLMGQEIGEHNEMLDDLERNVDRTDSRLSSAMQKMRKFVRESEEKGSGWVVRSHNDPGVIVKAASETNVLIAMIPAIIKASIDRKRAGMVGEGKNHWPNVDIHDLTDLYSLLYNTILNDPDKVGHGREGYYFGARQGDRRHHDVEINKFFHPSHYPGSKPNRSKALTWNSSKSTEDMLKSVKPEVVAWAKKNMSLVLKKL
ncbi:snare domain protein [Moniliophthora roreri]|nr:snare domain protein [Moniliophthora roreri]